LNLVETGVASHAHWSRLAKKGSASKRKKRALSAQRKQKMKNKNENGRTLRSDRFKICRSNICRSKICDHGRVERRKN